MLAGDRPMGPVTARLQRRALAIYLALSATGMAPVLAGAPFEWRALGLGLIFPGAGHLYAGHPSHFLFFFGLFTASLVLWFATGNILLPPFVWLGAATLAATHTGEHALPWAEWAIPAGAGALLVLTAARRRVEHHLARRRGLDHAAYLEGLSLPARTAWPLEDLAPELSADAAGALRYVLDRALQPVDQLGGFDRLDPYQTAALRYQVYYADYALAHLQYVHTPAFHGYLSEAQRNLIAKMQRRELWGYWRVENLWGNLSTNLDPVRRDNVMLTGYLAVMIEAYASTTGDHRYDEPGSIDFRWSAQRSFPNDAGSLARALVDNLERSPLCLYACEPNWVYPMCNTFALTALLLRDRRTGSEDGARILPSFRRRLEEEFVDADGRFVTIRSNRLGVRVPILRSLAGDFMILLWLHGALPDIAERSWEIIRRRYGDVRQGGDARIRFELADRIDVGNYALSDISSRAALLAAAREMGDGAIYDVVHAAVEQGYGRVVQDGELCYRHASNLANLILALARFSRSGAIHDLVRRELPEPQRRGPLLVDAPYPDALVTRAHSDGEALRLVLRPCGPGSPVRLRVGRLAPGRSYAVTGAQVSTITADAGGRATFEVELDSRREVVVAPTS